MSLTIYHTDNFAGGRPASRELLIKTLAAHSGRDAGGIVIETAPGGKPYLAGGPEFSVSHSAGHWAVLVSERPCGLDVQVFREADWSAIAKRHFSEREADLVERFGGDAFFKLWTRREALVKSAGKSIFTDDVPELLLPDGEEVIKIFYEGSWRAVADLDMPGLYVSLAWTVDEEWIPKREAPAMRRAGF